MTTINQARDYFDTLNNDYGQTRIRAGKNSVNLIFSGNYWPGGKGKQYRIEVQQGFEAARQMIVKARLAAEAATRSAATNEEATNLMIRWFGNNTRAPRNWWKGLTIILKAVEQALYDGVNVYYRGDSSLIGKNDDYPSAGGQIEQQDIEGIAEAPTGARNRVMGLCEEFFEANKRKRGGVTSMQRNVSLKSKDSVAGTLIHEMSHNMCSTDDHDRPDNNRPCYGYADCRYLATNHPYLAWWNADNIEYFCEENMFGRQ